MDEEPRSARTLAELTGELEGERGRLDFVVGDDRDTSSAVRAVVSWSCRNLPPLEARLFRLLGLHPGPDFGALVAAVLADVPVPQAKRLLQALSGSHLVQASAAGRYRFHDVLRYYDLQRFDEVAAFFEESLDHLGRSLAIRCEIGDRRGEAELLSCLGKILLHQSHAGQARESWTEALAILSDLGAPQATYVARQPEALG